MKFTNFVVPAAAIVTTACGPRHSSSEYSYQVEGEGRTQYSQTSGHSGACPSELVVSRNQHLNNVERAIRQLDAIRMIPRGTNAYIIERDATNFLIANGKERCREVTIRCEIDLPIASCPTNKTYTGYGRFNVTHLWSRLQRLRTILNTYPSH